MTALRHRPRHAILAAAALVALLMASGCGSERTQADEPAASAAAFDQALHDRLPAGILARGTVRVGGGDPYPPASFFAADGRTIVGFEPDLAAALGRVLGVGFEFVNVDFTDLLPQLNSHKTVSSKDRGSGDLAALRGNPLPSRSRGWPVARPQDWAARHRSARVGHRADRVDEPCAADPRRQPVAVRKLEMWSVSCWFASSTAR